MEYKERFDQPWLLFGDGLMLFGTGYIRMTRGKAPESLRLHEFTHYLRYIEVGPIKWYYEYLIVLPKVGYHVHPEELTAQNLGDVMAWEYLTQFTKTMGIEEYMEMKYYQHIDN